MWASRGFFQEDMATIRSGSLHTICHSDKRKENY